MGLRIDYLSAEIFACFLFVAFKNSDEEWNPEKYSRREITRSLLRKGNWPDPRDQLLWENPGPGHATVLPSPAALLSQRRKALEKEKQKRKDRQGAKQKIHSAPRGLAGGLVGRNR